ncbi:MAG: YciI family protein [Eubacteriales bacterium]|nr:YciI family protein [Eubacteriales bacterium]
MNYIYLMKNIKSLSMEVVKKHIEHLKKLDNMGKLVLCGPFTDYEGGIVILKCRDINEAKLIADEDPFIKEGYKTYELMTLCVANKENNYGA